MALLLVDTDNLIDVANKDATAITRLTTESQRFTLAVSSITVMELIIGCRNKNELQALNRFLAKFQTVALNHRISELTMQLLQDYYLSHGLLIPDALIAASAIEQHIPLLTKNQRDFRFIQGLNLLSYLEIEDV